MYNYKYKVKVSIRSWSWPSRHEQELDKIGAKLLGGDGLTADWRVDAAVHISGSGLDIVMMGQVY